MPPTCIEEEKLVFCIKPRKKERKKKKEIEMITSIPRKMEDVNIPIHFRCPISLDLMKDPVTLSTGITYDRDSIEKWFHQGNKNCPVTDQQITDLDNLIPNHTLRRMLQEWSVQNYIQRVPTPRIPVTSTEVRNILSKLTVSMDRSNYLACRSLVEKIRSFCKESDRNIKCFITNGSVTVLSAAFHTFASSSAAVSPLQDGVDFLLIDILGLLIWMFSLVDHQTEEAMSFLGSLSSLRYIVRFLEHGDLPVKKNAVIVLKELLSHDQQYVNSIAKVHDQLDVLLFQLVKKPISHTTTKASLIIIYYMVSSERVASRLVNMGLIPLLLEILVDSDKSIAEISLSILDGICENEQGKEEALKNALTVPILVKKVLRMSQLGNSFAVSILWKLCSNLKREDQKGALVEVLQLGAFQKLLLLLQVGCADVTKDKATKLLKLLNPYRDIAECVDSNDYKVLKRRI